MRMLPDEFNLKNTAPPLGDFLQLRSKVGWGGLDENMAKKSLNNSLFNISKLPP